MNSRDLVIVADDPEYTVALFRAVVFVVWRARPSMPGVIASRGAMHKLRAAYPEGIGLLVVMEPGASLPNAEVRDAMIGTVRAMKSGLLAMVGLHEGQGFAAATMRSVITGLGLIARAAPAFAFVSSAEEACSRISASLSRGGASLLAVDLAEALRDLRAGSGGRAPA